MITTKRFLINTLVLYKLKMPRIRCRVDNCEVKYPSFNLPNEKQGVCCGKHKDDGMINIITKTCQHENCKKQPIFNVIGEKLGMFCKNHRTKGMSDVVTKKCEYDQCTKKPYFNNPSEKKGVFCTMHKTEGFNS